MDDTGVGGVDLTPDDFHGYLEHIADNIDDPSRAVTRVKTLAWMLHMTLGALQDTEILVVFREREYQGLYDYAFPLLEDPEDDDDDPEPQEH